MASAIILIIPLVFSFIIFCRKWKIWLWKWRPKEIRKGNKCRHINKKEIKSGKCRRFLFFSLMAFTSQILKRKSIRRDLRPSADNIKWKRTSSRCDQALLGSFHFIISQVLPTVTNDFLFHFLFKRRAIEPQLVIWRWIALRKGNESLAVNSRHKEERENESRSIIWSVFTFLFFGPTDRSFISLLLLCADWPGLW